MSQNLNSSLIKVYEKIRSLARECIIDIDPIKKDLSQDLLISTILKMLEDIRKYIINISRVQDDYDKLQKQIQKYEQDIRNHIALQQQLKLFGQSLRQQLDDSQATRSQFLDNTKKIIADLKRENQLLYQQNREMKQQFQNKGKHHILYKLQSSTKKKRRAQSSAQQLRRPIKTQFVEIQETPKQTIKVKFELPKHQRSISQLEFKKRKDTSLKKKQFVRKQGKIRSQIKSYINFKDIELISKEHYKTIDPDEKRKADKLLRQVIIAESRHKHYKSQQNHKYDNEFRKKTVL